MIVVPNLYGRVETLRVILNNYPESVFMFLGGVISDRGDSRECLKIILELWEKDRAKFCIGGPEITAWRYLDSIESIPSGYNSKKEFEMDLESYLTYAEHYHTENSKLFSYAGIPEILGGTVIGEIHLTADASVQTFKEAPYGITHSYHAGTIFPSPKVIRPDEVFRHYINLGPYNLAVYDTEKDNITTYTLNK